MRGGTKSLEPFPSDFGCSFTRSTILFNFSLSGSVLVRKVVILLFSGEFPPRFYSLKWIDVMGQAPEDLISIPPETRIGSTLSIS